jgi:hypothetical protein
MAEPEECRLEWSEIAIRGRKWRILVEAKLLQIAAVYVHFICGLLTENRSSRFCKVMVTQSRHYGSQNRRSIVSRSAQSRRSIQVLRPDDWVGRGFLRKVKDQWNQRAERPKNYGQKKNWSAVGAEQILERVSEHFESNLERLKERSSRNNLARR